MLIVDATRTNAVTPTAIARMTESTSCQVSEGIVCFHDAMRDVLTRDGRWRDESDRDHRAETGVQWTQHTYSTSTAVVSGIMQTSKEP